MAVGVSGLMNQIKAGKLRRQSCEERERRVPAFVIPLEDKNCTKYETGMKIYVAV